MIAGAVAPLTLLPLLHNEALALLRGESEYAHRSGFSHLAAWGLYDPEELGTLSDEGDAPGARRRSSGFCIGQLSGTRTRRHGHGS